MHVIVTGGSSGIGLEVARIYAGRGAKLTLIARDPVKLENARLALQSPRADIRVASADITVSAEISAATAAAEAEFGPCDILIACAGIVEPATFETQPAAAFDAQLATNLFGTINAVRAVYSGMRQRRAGKIMIVSSGAALIGLHGYSAYCASKSALTGFAEALAMEARGAGVDILICYPPDTLTPQLERELLVRSKEAQALMGKAPAWRPEAVARKIVRAVDRAVPKLSFGFSLTALAIFGPLIKPVLFRWYGRR